MLYPDLKTISIDQLEDYTHVYALNGYKLPNKDVYHKYIPLNYLRDYFLNQHITFVSPSTWCDPFEMRYYKINYQAINYTEPSIFCMCVTDKQSQNEDAMWMRYAKPGEEMVRINIAIEPLLDLLECQGRVKNFKTYIGEAIYASKADILRVSKSNHKFFPVPFKDENYLTLMSFKRGSFSYENEIRIFIVPEKNDPPGKNLVTGLYYQVVASNINAIINQITVSPYPAQYVPFPHPDSQSFQESKKERITIDFPNVKVKASRLFEDCPKCKL